MKLHHELDNEMEACLKKSVFVGRLATEEEVAEALIDEVIKFQDEYDEFLMFNLKCLSPIPKPLSDLFYYHNRIFRGSTRSPNNLQKIKTVLIPNYDRLHPYDRIDRLRQTMHNQLVLFTLSSSHLNLNVHILKIEETVFHDQYAVIPGPMLRMDESREDFEDRILTGRPILLPYYPNVFQNPIFLFCEDVLYGNLRLRPSENPTTYYVDNPEDVRTMKVAQDFFSRIVSRYDDSIYVLDEKLVPVLTRDMEAEGEWLTKVGRIGRNKAQGAEGEDSAVGPAADSEMKFLERLNENAKLRGLYYDMSDLINFHISVKTNLLTIVGGMSGTGKSQLAVLYGETLGLSYGHRLRMVPVSPSYHEPGDLLGYLNPASGVYHEAEAGLVSILLEAEQHPDQLFMVVFDEMNLSQVEHWFSPFISLLELEAEKRTLDLFHPDSPCTNGYKPIVRIGDNVMFVGTLNFDETTKGFSSRLLDRTNVIIPRKLSFKEVRGMQTGGRDRSIIGMNVSRRMYKEEWVKDRIMDHDDELSHLTDAEIDLMDQLHDALQQTNSQMGVSFRVLRAIAAYLRNIPLNEAGKEMILRGTALDLQVQQRILSKLSGMESAIGAIVGHFDGEDYQDGTVAEVLRSAQSQQLSTFKRSLEMLRRKAKELAVHGYVY